MPITLTPEEQDYADKIKKYVDEENIFALKKLLKSKPGTNLDRLGLSPTLFKCVERGSALELIKILLDHGVNVDMLDKDMRSPLMLAAINQDRKICELLIASGADVTNNIMRFLSDKSYEYDAIYLRSCVGSEFRSSLRQCILFAVSRSRANFLAEYNFSKPELEKLKKVAAAIIFLQLTYSEFEEGGFVRDNIKTIASTLKDLIDNEQDAVFQESLKKYREAIDVVDGKKIKPFSENPAHKIQVVNLPYKNHAAFCIIEDRGDGSAVTLSYCDGNLPLSKINEFGYGYGQIKYFVKPKLLSDIVANIAKAFSADEIEEDKHGFDSITKALAGLVECDENGLPQVAHQGLPTKPQKRGNCSMKALNMAAKEVVSAMHPEMKFEKEVGGSVVPAGDGYDLYKNYKRSIVAHSIYAVVAYRQCLETSADSDSKTIFGAILDNILQDIFLHASAKGNIRMTSFIQAIQEKNYAVLDEFME